MLRNRLLSLGALLLVAGALATGAWALFLRPVRVEVVDVQRDVPVQVFGLGTVEAKVVSRIGFEVMSTLVDLHADFGDRVGAGALLARVDSREQEARVAQARAAVVQMESMIHQAAAAIEHAEATATQRAQANDRRQQLVQRGTVSAEAAEDAKAAHAIARADLDQARSAAETARANLEQARALVALEEARLAKYTLYAPYDATVVSRNRELGSMLNPGENLFTLVDPKTVWILAYVNEVNAGQVSVGQKASVTLRSRADRTFAGHVVRIDIESDRVNEERRVYVRCDDCPAEFHLGEQAEVMITVGEIAQARLVPQVAVTGLAGRHGVVWTVENGRLAQRAVMFGQRTLDGQIEIVDGLPSGAEVVVRPTTTFKAGRAVSVDAKGRL